MKSIAVIDFLSRDCKYNEHNNCDNKWSGLGFEVICHCTCHKKKEQQALGKVGGPVSNATSSLSQEPTQDDG